MDIDKLVALFHEVLEGFNTLDNQRIAVIELVDARKIELARQASRMDEWQQRLKDLCEAGGRPPAAPTGAWSEARLFDERNNPFRLQYRLAPWGGAIDAEPDAGEAEPTTAPAEEAREPVKKAKKVKSEAKGPAEVRQVEAIEQDRLLALVVYIKSSPANKKAWVEELEGKAGTGKLGETGKSKDGEVPVTFYFDNLADARAAEERFKGCEFVFRMEESTLDQPRAEFDRPWFDKLEKWVDHLSACADVDTLKSALGVDSFGVQLYTLPRSVLKAAYNTHVNKPYDGVYELLVVIGPEHQLKDERVARMSSILRRQPKKVVASPPDTPGFDVVWAFQTFEEPAAAYAAIQHDDCIRGYDYPGCPE